MPHTSSYRDSDLAIIGMSCRVPGAADCSAFWSNLSQGVESISWFSDQELLACGVSSELLRNPNYVKANAVVEGIENFDATFFGFTPSEAGFLDPQQRLFLEVAWEALESAGYNNGWHEIPIGCFAGAALNTYLLFNLMPGFDPSESSGMQRLMVSSDKDFLATRVSYKLDLRGPSMTVQTACSSSLVAVHQAAQSILNGECDIAIAGGVCLRVPHRTGYLFQEGGVFSPDGHCRPFDESARGMVIGNGAGAVVLKRLSAAMEDGDTILAVLKGSAVNNDGAEKPGYTAPSLEAQAAVITEAQAVAGILPDEIGFVEAHGTGTELGDPIEVAALTKAFRLGTQRRSFCALGSVKSNFGHLDAAAGVVSLIKTVLSLQNRQIPATLHFQRPNPKMGLEESPFFVNRVLADWGVASGSVRLAGVSSFGIGGTNAHVILAEAPVGETGSREKTASPQLLVVSGRSRAAAEQAASELAAFLSSNPQLDPMDAAFTTGVARRSWEFRKSFIWNSPAAMPKFPVAPSDDVMEASVDDPPGVVFLFPGQGAHHAGMARQLFESEPVFTKEFERCNEISIRRYGLNLRELVYGDGGGLNSDRTELVQPALFAVEYALARLWISWGLRPVALLGHSLGEYVAATISGVFELEDAMSLVLVRGRLMSSLPGGAMLSVRLTPEEIKSTTSLSIAAINGPSDVVVSGTVEQIEQLERSLELRGIGCRRLQTSHAFHSPLIEPIEARFGRELDQARPGKASVPILSNVSGDWIQPGQVMPSSYWLRQMRQPVLFSACLEKLLARGNTVLLEVGPGRILSTLAQRHPAKPTGLKALVSIGDSDNLDHQRERMLQSLGVLWSLGCPVDWNSFWSGRRGRRIPIPTYPFQRKKFWVEPQKVGATRLGRSTPAVPAGRFYLNGWKRSVHAFPVNSKAGPWVIVLDELGWGQAIEAELRRMGEEVYSFSQKTVAASGFPDLGPSLVSAGRFLWFCGLSNAGKSGGGSPSQVLQELLSGFNKLPGNRNNWRLFVVTCGSCDVTGVEELDPVQSALLGLIKVVRQEHPNVKPRAIDLENPLLSSLPISRFLRELMEDGDDLVVALRGTHRWVQDYSPAPLAAAFPALPQVKRHGGVYLILGGFGSLGFAFAEALLRQGPVKLILVGRSEFPERDRWDVLADPVLLERVRAVHSLESKGAEVLILSADLSDSAQVEAVLKKAEQAFGGLTGIVHAAGVRVHATLEESSPEVCDRLFAPKVESLRALDRFLTGRQIDFVAITSSLASVMGGAGLAAYSGAHLFVDAFAASARRRHSTPWLVINWDNWAGNGPSATGALLSHAEGQDLFLQGLQRLHHGQLIVSKTDLDERLKMWLELGFMTDGPPVELHERPELADDFVAPSSPTELLLAEIWRGLLGIERVGIHDNFLELGGDSVLGIMFVAKAAARGLHFSPRDIFQYPTIAELAEVGRQGRESHAHHDQHPVVGRVPLHPIQHWFFDQRFDQPDQYLHQLNLSLRPDITFERLRTAIQRLTGHHDALRSRFARDQLTGEWIQEYLAKDDAIYCMDSSVSDFDSAVENVRRAISLERGPVQAVVFSRTSEGVPSRMAWILHHLVVDGWSWRLLMEDLQSLLASGANAVGEPSLPPRTASCKEWNSRLPELLSRAAEADFWGQHSSGPRLPVDFETGANNSGSVAFVRMNGSVNSTPATVEEVLLDQLVQEVAVWSGSAKVWIDREGHGRDPIPDGLDVSRTVGWFTALHPVLFDSSRPVGPQLQKIPNGGMGYGLLRQQGKAGQHGGIEGPDLAFLFLGELPEASSSADRCVWPEAQQELLRTPPDCKRTHLLEVRASIAGGRLQVEWAYSIHRHSDETIRALAERVMTRTLEGLSGGGVRESKGGPDDFADSGLSESELSDLLGQLDP